MKEWSRNGEGGNTICEREGNERGKLIEEKRSQKMISSQHSTSYIKKIKERYDRQTDRQTRTETETET